MEKIALMAQSVKQSANSLSFKSTILRQLTLGGFLWQLQNYSK